jgi:DUF1680 family protein
MGDAPVASATRTGTDAGPVAPLSTDRLTLRPLRLSAVELDPIGHLGAWQSLNASETIPHCIANVESSGAVDNVRRLLRPGGPPFRGPLFADSDIYKTLEAVAWEAARSDDPSLREYLEGTAALLAQAQDEDGYLDSYYQGVHPDRRFQELSRGHEMYCAGHLIQAAVAAYRTTGSVSLLEVARRLADLLVRTFGGGAGARDGICGHPEIETALVELYRATDEPAYLALAQRMIELRGHGLLPDHGPFAANYFQDHLPVREATAATGHAVRQLYLAAGVMDVYLERGDPSLLEAMERLWADTFGTKTYITGGHGSRHRDEAFGDPYELPPDRAYAETCAAIASFMWNWRLLLATGRGRYADEMERALYNAIAVSTAMDGRHFTYSNPLQLRPGHDGSHEDSPSGRLPWFGCACCPPNLARLVASLQHYVATWDADGVQLHLFAAGRVSASGPYGEVELDVRTEYPWDGRVSITVVRGEGPWTLSLRAPSWCEGPAADVNGVRREERPDASRYLRLRGPWTEGTAVTLELPMPTRLVRAHAHVDAVRGCGALMRGPLVYCIESGDAGEGVPIDDIAIDPAHLPAPSRELGSDVAPVVLAGPAMATRTGDTAPLYRAGSGSRTAPTQEVTLVAIPYFRWANRGVRDMRVWLPIRGEV